MLLTPELLYISGIYSGIIMYKRTLEINLPQGQSAFLWGARKSGKSTYLKSRYPDSLRFDFLKTDLRMEIIKRPSLFRERILALEGDPRLKHPIILDEIQKVPAILDEIHWLIEEKGLSFLMCGSSARKLRRGHVNLLGGRAWRYEMFPLTYKEIGELNLLDALNKGLLPSHYLNPMAGKSLKAYILDYLNEEIRNEGLVRNFPAFSRFLDAVAFTNGELAVWSNIASDCGIDAKTVKEYFQILNDTLLGHTVQPFSLAKSRQLISKTSKFYLFDVGVAGALKKRFIEEERGAEFGAAFEHFICMELFAYKSYTDKDFDISFWRTSTGLEVDFILGNGRIAIEVKGSSEVSGQMIRGIKAFEADYKPKRSIVVCNEKAPRKLGTIEILPWRIFLNNLYDGEII